MNVFNIKFSHTFELLYTTQRLHLYDLISLQTPRNTRSSSVVTLSRLAIRSSLKIPVVLFAMLHSLTSGINLLTSLARPWSASSWFISSPRSSHIAIQCHHHHSYHSSLYHSFFPTSKLFSFSNHTLHRYVAPLLDWFYRYLDLFTVFFRFSFFKVLVIVI